MKLFSLIIFLFALFSCGSTNTTKNSKYESLVELKYQKSTAPESTTDLKTIQETSSKKEDESAKKFVGEVEEGQERDKQRKAWTTQNR